MFHSLDRLYLLTRKSDQIKNERWNSIIFKLLLDRATTAYGPTGNLPSFLRGCYGCNAMSLPGSCRPLVYLSEVGNLVLVFPKATSRLAVFSPRYLCNAEHQAQRLPILISKIIGLTRHWVKAEFTFAEADAFTTRPADWRLGLKQHSVLNFQFLFHQRLSTIKTSK